MEKTEKNNKVQEILENTLEGIDEVQEVVDNLTLSVTAETLCVGSSKASKNREQSLNSTAGVALNCTNQEEVMEIMVNPRPQETYNDNHDYSQNSLSEGTYAEN